MCRNRRKHWLFKLKRKRNAKQLLPQRKKRGWPPKLSNRKNKLLPRKKRKGSQLRRKRKG